MQENLDIYFEPIVTVQAVEVKSDEEQYNVILKMRAKLFRFHKAEEESEGEWKERGTGDVKLLQDKKTHKINLLMRMEKTHKICALHQVSPKIVLKPTVGSDKSWLWNVYADYADEKPTSEVFAMKFQNQEAAMKFKQVFEQCQATNQAIEEGTYVQKDNEGELSEKLEQTSISSTKAEEKVEEAEKKPSAEKVVEKAAGEATEKAAGDAEQKVESTAESTNEQTSQPADESTDQ